MRPAPKTHPLYLRQRQAYGAAKLSDGVTKEAEGERLSQRDGSQVLGMPEDVLRLVRAH